MCMTIEAIFAAYDCYCAGLIEAGETPLPFEDFCWREAAA